MQPDATHLFKNTILKKNDKFTKILHLWPHKLGVLLRQESMTVISFQVFNTFTTT